jgi:hypothetical protein
MQQVFPANDSSKLSEEKMNTTLVLDGPSQLSVPGRRPVVRILDLDDASCAVAAIPPEELLEQEQEAESTRRSVVAAGGEGALRPVLDGTEVHAVLAGLGYWGADPTRDDLGD